MTGRHLNLPVPVIATIPGAGRTTISHAVVVLLVVVFA